MDGVDHHAACIRSNELVATEVQPEDIFATDTSDTLLAAEAALGEALVVEPTETDGEEDTRP